MTAMTLMTLIGFGAISVDLGLLQLTRYHTQQAADAAVLAAVGRLDGTAEGITAAIASAVEIGNANGVMGTFTLKADQVEFGSYDDETGALVFGDAHGLDPKTVNVVRVSATASGITAAFAAAAFGRTELFTGAVATATRDAGGGAGAVDCFLPLAVAACLVEQDDTVVGGLELVLSPAGIDNAGWGRPGANPNASTEIANVISGGTGTTWDPTVYGAIPGQMAGSSVDPASYGNTIEGPILVFDGGPGYCSGGGGAFNGTEDIIGFVWAAVYDVRATGAASEKNIILKLDKTIVREVGTQPGGEDYGVAAPASAARMIE